jgi:hypothetical protein
MGESGRFESFQDQELAGPQSGFDTILSGVSSGRGVREDADSDVYSDK